MSLEDRLKKLPGGDRTISLARNIQTFRAGLRDARELKPASLPDTQPDVSRLEQYFDSISEGPGVWKWRHYFRIYERHLAKFVGSEFTMVEVGIYSGGSLSMWRNYFGDGCHIVGVDIEDACRVYEGEGIDVMIGDQADPDFWREVRTRFPKVDVLVDDGGHEAHQQQVTLREMLPHLQPGGVYLCEDIHGGDHAFHSYVDGLARLIHHDLWAGGEPQPVHEHVESVHRYPLVTVIEKPASQVPRFEAPKHGSHWEPWID
jgi:hypothetical protein